MDVAVPVDYKIDALRGTIRTRCFGHLTLSEVIGHFQRLARDPACPARPDVFLDLSAVDTLPTPAQMPTVIEQLQAIEGRVQFGACAIVAARDALFGMMRMFEAMGEKYFRVTRTFRETAEAEAWLAAEQAHAARKQDRAAG